ncbi:ATP-binding cassette, subfamily B, MsbA [Sesbania bispinosa]|nr:ATP-binding cassette, subfamily B, MsbA [Sesbania bispinosa]
MVPFERKDNNTWFSFFEFALQTHGSLCEKENEGKKSRVLTGETQRFLAQRTVAPQLKCFAKTLPRTTAWCNEVENLSNEVLTLSHGMVLSDASFNETVVTLIAGLLRRDRECGGVQGGVNSCATEISYLQFREEDEDGCLGLELIEGDGRWHDCGEGHPCVENAGHSTKVKSNSGEALVDLDGTPGNGKNNGVNDFVTIMIEKTRRISYMGLVDYVVEETSTISADDKIEIVPKETIPTASDPIHDTHVSLTHVDTMQIQHVEADATQNVKAVEIIVLETIQEFGLLMTFLT